MHFLLDFSLNILNETVCVQVMLSTPQTLSDALRAGLMTALIEGLGVQGVCMVQQSLLALYSYRTTTGIIVDIGHRIEILPIYDGECVWLNQ